MRAPRSYTKEDVVEINCHGGIIPLRRVFELVLENGCRVAQPGEFTKRAFLNGRIDLAQAEAVLDIIRAKTDSSLKLAAGQLEGALSRTIGRMREILLGLLARIEAGIDFPEEGIESIKPAEAKEELSRINNELSAMLDDSKTARVLRDGLHAVICGRPNVGKSSLLNALLKEERSIVTSIPGTTRDTIEEIIDIKGIPIRIVDTAGIIEPKDFVERKAVERAKRQVNLADLVILVFDGSRPLSRLDQSMAGRLKKKCAIAVINKIDLRQRIDKRRLLGNFKSVVEISAKKSVNINLLEDSIADMVYNGKVRSPEAFMVNNLRHIELLRKTQNLIEEAIGCMDNNLLQAELLAQDLKDAAGCLDELLGKRFSEELLDKIFAEFCIGK